MLMTGYCRGKSPVSELHSFSQMELVGEHQPGHHALDEWKHELNLCWPALPKWNNNIWVDAECRTPLEKRKKLKHHTKKRERRKGGLRSRRDRVSVATHSSPNSTQKHRPSRTETAASK